MWSSEEFIKLMGLISFLQLVHNRARFASYIQIPDDRRVEHWQFSERLRMLTLQVLELKRNGIVQAILASSATKLVNLDMFLFPKQALRTLW